MRKRPRSKRIRCQCCTRLMAFEPYKRGDAIRRPAPNAGHCLDCTPGDRAHQPTRRHWQNHEPMCYQRGCVPASAVDKLASIARRSQ